MTGAAAALGLGRMAPTAAHGLGDRWQARWRDPAGQQRKKNFARKADAERQVATVAVDMNRGAYIDPRAGRILLRDYAAQWIEAQRESSTRDTNRSRLESRVLPVLGVCQLGQVQASLLRPWLAGLDRELEPNTVRAVFGVLYSVMQAAVDDGLIAKNPCAAKTVKLPPKPDVRIVPWTAAQVASVADSIGGSWRAAVLAAGAALGLRQGEILGLAVADIDFLRRVVHVRRQLQWPHGVAVLKLPKGDKARDVPLSGRAAVVLSEHIAAHPPVTVRLPFGTADGKPVSVRLLFSDRGKPARHQSVNDRIWKPALRAAGMETSGPDDKVSMHALRHYAASAWLAGGQASRTWPSTSGTRTPHSPCGCTRT